MDVMERSDPNDFKRQAIRRYGGWSWFLVMLSSKTVHQVSVFTVNYLVKFLRGVYAHPQEHVPRTFRWDSRLTDSKNEPSPYLIGGIFEIFR